MFHGQFLPLSGHVPRGVLQDGVSAPAALRLAQQLPCAWAEPLGVSMGLMCCIVCPAAKIHAWSFGEAAPECSSVTGALGLRREGCQAWPWILSTILGLAGACLVQVPAALGELPEPLKNPSTFLAASSGLAGSPGIPGPAPAELAHTCTTPASQNAPCLAPIPAEPDPTSLMVLSCASTVCWKESRHMGGQFPLLSQRGQHSGFILFSASLSPDTLPVPGGSGGSGIVGVMAGPHVGPRG